jgi:head-tail adaptor
MKRIAAGVLDRRVQVQELAETKDAAGDVLKTDWRDVFKLWAMRRAPNNLVEVSTAKGDVRQADVVFRVRDGSKSRTIAPESHRLLYQGRVHEIVGIVPDEERDDLIRILTCVRPDQRGSRSNEGASGEP